MIRLTETGRQAQQVVVKVEGNLTDDTLPVLAQALEEYHRAGVVAVQLLVDGVVSVDRLAFEAWLRREPLLVACIFVTSRTVLHQLLANCGVKVVSQ